MVRVGCRAVMTMSLAMMVAAMGSPPLKSTAMGLPGHETATMQKTGGYGVAQAMGGSVDDAVASSAMAEALMRLKSTVADADDRRVEHVQHGGVVECLQAGTGSEGGVVFALTDDACGDLGV